MLPTGAPGTGIPDTPETNMLAMALRTEALSVSGQSTAKKFMVGKQSFSEARWSTRSSNKYRSRLVAAIGSYPLLRSYVVCLPLNLPNARKAGQKSARDRWDEHRAR